MIVVFKYKDKVLRFEDKLFKSGIISNDKKKTLKTSGFMLGIIYELPKVQRSDVPMRPILSSVNSHNPCSKNMWLSF